jgi:hypothetical protein
MRTPIRFAVLALAALSSTARADVLLTRKTHQDAYKTPEGEVPAKDGTTLVWVGKDRLRLEDGERITLVRLDAKKLFVLDPVTKTASSVDLPVDLVKLAPPEIAQMLSRMTTAITLTSETTTETKRIQEWDTTKSVVRMGGSANAEITVWITKDSGVDNAAYADLVAHAMSVRPGGTALAAEMRKFGGVSALTERVQTTAGIQLRSRDELVSAKTQDAPPGTYDVPADYTLKPFDAVEEIARSMPKRPVPAPKPLPAPEPAPAPAPGGPPR